MNVDQLLQLALSIIGTMTLLIGNKIAKDIHKLTESVDILNIKLATIVERVDHHEKRITKIEERV